MLIGHSGSGKSRLCQLLADSRGYVYSAIDCLAHLNFSKMKALFADRIPRQTNLPQVVELVGFSRYAKLMDGAATG